jgi:hypothetical protein
MKYDDYTMNSEYTTGEDMEELEPCTDGCTDGSPESVSRKYKKMIEVEEVVGMGSEETIVEVCIPLNPPAFEIMEDLITKDVIFDALIASEGKVFVNGRIIKDIPYKTRVKVCVPGCENISKLTFGNVKHVTAEIPFALCIDVPGAKKGLKVVVLDFNVNSVEIPNHTNCLPNKCIAVCEPPFKKMDPCMRRLFCSLTEKDCISVKVKVVKDSIITVPHFAS